jgi:hypothetical protein
MAHFTMASTAQPHTTTLAKPIEAHATLIALVQQIEFQQFRPFSAAAVETAGIPEVFLVLFTPRLGRGGAQPYRRTVVFSRISV